MRLISLTLAGFKSFGDRTQVDFAPGVTAIVGPNGSGKSNLIDALRWTSGGGRAGSFRAEDKTDLIFHGAAGKRRMGFGEVSLELTGKRGAVHISRQIFRDGATKLRLNGKASRFMDIEEQLAGSGLGRGSLAIIGQGEVSQVLMADPERLLSYVAEAAGVATLSSRRVQTVSRLDTARENLERLSDLIVELQSQVELLSEEAAQAERATALQRERLRLSFSLSLARLESLSQEIDKLSSEQNDAEAELQRVKRDLAAEQERWDKGRTALADAELSYRQALTETEARRGDVRVAEERLRNVQTYQTTLKRDLQQTRADLEALKVTEPPVQPEGDAAELNEQLTAIGERIKEKQADIEAAQASHTEALRALDAARQEHRDQEQAKLAFEVERKRLRSELHQAEAQLASLSDGSEETTRAAADVDRYKQAVESAREALEGLRETLVQHQKAHAQAVAQSQALDAAAERSRRIFESRRGYAEGPKNALTSGVSGVIGSVADLVEVAADYREAVSAALGRRAEYVVVDTAVTGKKVLAYLKKSGGWATLLPMDLLQARQPSLPPALAKAPGVIGLLADWVEVRPQHRVIVRQLLGSTVLVETLDHAVALGHVKPRPRLITMTGDILEGYGAMSGGQNRRGPELIGAARDLEAAEAKALEAREVLVRVENALVEAQSLAKARSSDLNSLQEELESARQTLTGLREREAAQGSLRSELTSRSEALKEQLEGLEAPAEKVWDLGSLEERLVEAETELALRRSEMERIREERFSLDREQALYAERRTRFQEASERFEQAKTQHETLSRRLEALTLDVDKVHGETEQAERALAEAKAALPQDLELKEQTYQTLKDELAASEQRFNALTRKQAEQGAHLESLKLTLARRDAALELAHEDHKAFPEGVERVEGSSRSLRDRLNQAEQELEDLGPVNHRAAQDLALQVERLSSLETQRDEALEAIAELEGVLDDIDRETTSRLNVTLSEVENAFTAHVADLFGDGAVSGMQVDRLDGRPVGIRIDLQPPGKQTRSLNLLSVGERTMGAMAFLFALIGEGLPVAILDEVDAPLDEANIRRFCRFLNRLASAGTQFVLITHQKATMEVADVLWGVTTEQGVSRVFSIAKSEQAAAG